MHDMLFEHQDALDDEDLLLYAAALGLDLDRFAHELELGLHAARVREDFLSGVRSGVNGTPTFFINGRRHEGASDVQTLLAAIAAAARANGG
jgi:protein-disulfide isomerase